MKEVDQSAATAGKTQELHPNSSKVNNASELLLLLFVVFVVVVVELDKSHSDGGGQKPFSRLLLCHLMNSDQEFCGCYSWDPRWPNSLMTHDK